MTPDVPALVADLALALRTHSAQPTAWQAESTPYGLSFSAVPGHDRSPAIRSFPHARRAAVLAIDAALRGQDDHRMLALELLIDGDVVEFTHSFELSALCGPHVVAEREPEPAATGAPPSTAPTDAQVMARIGQLLEEFTERYRELKGRDPERGEPASEAEIAAAERELGVRLPEDLRAVHRLWGHDFAEVRFLGRVSPVSLAQMVDYRDLVPIPAGPFDDEVVLEAHPPGFVRRDPDARRVYFGADYCGSSFAVDLDPGPLGQVGQVIETGRGIDFPEYVAPSVTALLTAVMDALRDGRSGPEDNRAKAPEHTESLPLAAADLTESLAALPDAAAVQRLYLHGAESVDLRALAATPSLRALIVSNTDRVLPWAPPELESLDVAARECDVRVLDGHPRLWDLTLAGPRVRAGDLAGLPALTRLDLSSADVDEVAAVAELGVRVLTLSLAQWQAVRAAGRLPARLTAARLGGNNRLPDALDWTQWITAALAGPR